MPSSGNGRDSARTRPGRPDRARPTRPAAGASSPETPLLPSQPRKLVQVRAAPGIHVRQHDASRGHPGAGIRPRRRGRRGCPGSAGRGSGSSRRCASPRCPAHARARPR
jgi:hypothetical protein